MKIYRSPIEVEEIIKLAKNHDYGSTWITVVIPIDFRKLVESPFIIDFDKEISANVSPNDSPLHGIEYNLVGFEDENQRILVEITGDAREIIDEYNLEMEQK